MKKRISLPLCMAIVMLLLAQCTKKHDGFTINGEVNGFEDSTMLYLNDPKKETTIDSSLVINGQFEFKGFVEEPQMLYIHTQFKRGTRPVYTYFWAENSPIQIKGTKNQFRLAEVSGSKTHEKANILYSQTNKMYDKRDSLVQLVYKMKDENKAKNAINAVIHQIQEIDSSRNELELQFIKEHTNSYAALQQMIYKKTELPKDTMRRLYEKLEPRMKESSYGKVIHTYLNSKQAKEGGPYIDFMAKTFEGDMFKLSQIEDKYILLNFWAAGCGACRVANKSIAKKYPELKDKIEIIGFSVDKNKENLAKAIKEDSIQWPVVSTYQGIQGPIPIQYKIRGTPTFYLINPEGKIVKKYFGYSEETLKEIMTQVKEPTI